MRHSESDASSSVAAAGVATDPSSSSGAAPSTSSRSAGPPKVGLSKLVQQHRVQEGPLLSRRSGDEATWLSKRKELLEVARTEIFTHKVKKGLDGTVFAVYPINVTMTSGRKWVIEKRYADFRALRREIILVRPDLADLPFPHKNWFFNLSSSVLRHRQEKLGEYLSALLKTSPRPLELGIFLQVANNVALRQNRSASSSGLSSSTSNLLSNVNGNGFLGGFSSFKGGAGNGANAGMNYNNNSIYNRSFCSLSASMSVKDFQILKVLGKGSFGKVFLVRPVHAPLSEVYAMKVLRKAEVVKRKQVDHTMAERNIMAEISHPYILCLRYAFQTSQKLYMITDYCAGGELFFHLKKMRRFTEGMMRFYSAQISLALQHLHHQQVVYRDLKPENILLDRDGNCKITDFGLSKTDHKDKDPTSTFCGTPEYLSPEMLIHRNRGTGYGFEIDWWALGIVCFELLTGWPPFFDRDFHKMYVNAMHI